MRPLPVSLIAALLILPAGRGLHAQDLVGTCHASSSYDVTLKPGSVLFDRPQPAPFHVELRDGALRTDGAAVRLNAEDQDRLALFERDLRALAPRVRTVAQAGVALAARAMREEAAGMQLSAATRSELERRLAARAGELEQRIAASNSTHDWQGDLVDRYASQLAGEILPLLAADLGQQALDAALSGDLQAAASLRDRAADLSTQLRPRLERRMQALQPQIQALCPAVRQLAELQQGVHAGNGQPLGLLQIDQ